MALAAAVRRALEPDTRLVALMLANNELGTLQPVAEVAAACGERGVPVLCDAVQAVGKIQNVVGWFVNNAGKMTNLVKAIMDSVKAIAGGAASQAAGLIERATDGTLYNTYVVALPDGRTVRHRKLHCFISAHMASGDAYTVIDIPQGARVGVLICYDNNLVENAIRPSALGKKNWLFIGHPDAGQRSAIIYTLLGISDVRPASSPASAVRSAGWSSSAAAREHRRGNPLG